MNVTEFEDLIDRHGEDFSRWPDVKREAAVVLLRFSPAARELMEEARLIRDALSAPKVLAPAGLADRIFAQAFRTTARTSAAGGEAAIASIDATHSG